MHAASARFEALVATRRLVGGACHDETMRIAGVESTDLFVGTAQRPLQVVRVTLDNDGPAEPADTSATIYLDGPGIRTPGPFGLTGLGPGEQGGRGVGRADLVAGREEVPRQRAGPAADLEHLAAAHRLEQGEDPRGDARPVVAVSPFLDEGEVVAVVRLGGHAVSRW